MANNQDPSSNYDIYVVEREQPLLEFLLEHVKTLSRSKVKMTLQGRGIMVEGKTVTQFDYPLKPGMEVAVSRSKKNAQTFRQSLWQCEEPSRRCCPTWAN